ncbi:MAG: UDP-3-O-acyl-N-acetylglucosamine deacetylase [Desulfovibrio sp.]|jgi:UDP-3-O-[3-hydroxymyristoyl] N-acetylglucosamine deacetylase|nr:UDP-3-O-acyl-N-acetylglucosamine deacetylase [Desulfovibrio sp.]
MQQISIKRKVQCSGIGLHSGKPVSLAFRPAAEDSGIIFHVKGEHGSRTLRPDPELVLCTSLATTLGGSGVFVATVEHLMAALRGLGIDNIHIDVEGGEIPIMDGSAAAFVQLIGQAGLRTQGKPRRVARVSRPLHFERAGKFISAEPYEGFFVDCSISFPHPLIGVQRFSLDLTPETFSQVAGARTFGFLRDVEEMQKRGLALGGSLDNALVLDEKSVLNADGLQWPDEFVRHKILDFIGDMAMYPLPIQGRFRLFCSGHGLNNAFLRHIAQEQCLDLRKDPDLPLYGDAAYMPERRFPALAPACAG